MSIFDDLGATDAKEFWKTIKMLNSTKKTTIPATLTDGAATAESSHSNLPPKQFLPWMF